MHDPSDENDDDSQTNDNRQLRATAERSSGPAEPDSGGSMEDDVDIVSIGGTNRGTSIDHGTGFACYRC